MRLKIPEGLLLLINLPILIIGTFLLQFFLLRYLPTAALFIDLPLCMILAWSVLFPIEASLPFAIAISLISGQFTSNIFYALPSLLLPFAGTWLSQKIDPEFEPTFVRFAKIIFLSLCVQAMRFGICIFERGIVNLTLEDILQIIFLPIISGFFGLIFFALSKNMFKSLLKRKKSFY